MTFKRMILAALILGGIVVLMGLGFWQVQRMGEKNAMITRVEEGLSAAPVSVSEIAARLKAGDDIEYRPATAEGTFLHEGEAHYFATWNGETGFFIYTPLKQRNGHILFVNRGFVPYADKEASARPLGQVEGPVTISGLARSAPAEKPNRLVPDNDMAKNVFYWKNLTQMVARAYGLDGARVEPFFLDADDTVMGGAKAPLGGVTRIAFSDNHLQYALTWFGLALALMVVGGWFFFSSRSSSVKDAP